MVFAWIIVYYISIPEAQLHDVGPFVSNVRKVYATLEGCEDIRSAVTDTTSVRYRCMRMEASATNR